MTHRLALAAAAGLLAAAPAAAGPIAYSIDSSGTQLLRFDTATPGAVTVVGPFSTAGGVVALGGLDFRPSDGRLYGVSTGGTVYTVNTATGALTFKSTLTTAPDFDLGFGVDFNPQVVVGGVLENRLRLVSDKDQNLRANADTGATTVDGTLAYAAGDPNAGADPHVDEAAYTNSDTDINTPTQLYYIDYQQDVLATALAATGGPNAGVLTTVGGLGVDTTFRTGFDILTTSSGNSAYAILGGPNGSELFSINLATGAASSLGVLGPEGRGAYSLAVAPGAAAVPAPGLAGMAGGAAVVGLFRRLFRKRAAA